MSGEIIVSDVNIGYTYFVDTTLDGFSIEVYVPKGKNLESVLNNKEAFFTAINTKLREEKLMGFSDEDELKTIEILRDNYDHLWDYIDTIKLYNVNTSLREMIENNPIMLTKKIVLKDLYSINDYELLLNIYNEHKEFADKLYICLEGNEKNVPLLDAIFTIEEIHNQIGYVKSLNLSQMETIMYIYDYVRKRIYKFEDKNQETNESRDLTNVLFGDKIVCVGYTNLFNSMLNYLGICAEPIFYEGTEDDTHKNDGHVRSMVKVNDNKYHITGLFLFDPTWDSKRDKKNNDYLNSYKFFAKNVGFMNKYDKKYDLDENRFLKYYDDKYYVPLKIALKSNDINVLEEYIASLNHFARRIIGRNLIEPIHAFNGTIDSKKQEDILQKFLIICSYFKKSISAEKMIALVNNVRKVEYYQKHEYYPYSIDDLYLIAINSKWKFKHAHLTPYEKLIEAVFEEFDSSKREFIDDFIGYIKEQKIEYDINHVKVAKILRLTLDKKRENE